MSSISNLPNLSGVVGATTERSRTRALRGRLRWWCGNRGEEQWTYVLCTHNLSFRFLSVDTFVLHFLVRTCRCKAPMQSPSTPQTARCVAVPSDGFGDGLSMAHMSRFSSEN